MDFFSILPIILFFYAISTIFSSGNKKPNNQRPRPKGLPHYEKPRTPTNEPMSSSPKSWKERFEELERELFPNEESLRTAPKPGPISEGYSMNQHYKDNASDTRDAGGERRIGYEGTFGVEGAAGIEGISGVEGTVGVEGSFPVKQKTAIVRSKVPKSSSRRSQFPMVTESTLKQGVIWAEVLGKPRALRKWSYGRK